MRISDSLLPEFDHEMATTRKTLERVPEDNLTWTPYQKSMFTMPRVAVVRGMMLNPLSHHRGQLSVYLRLNNVPAPSIYGPSADEGSM